MQLVTLAGRRAIGFRNAIGVKACWNANGMRPAIRSHNRVIVGEWQQPWRRITIRAATTFAEQFQEFSGPVPVVLLSGFLGAGKTTLLDNLLRGDHGLRLAVIVNDLASVNVDAELLDGAVRLAGAQSIALANGCVCCSASDDLRRSILALSAGGDGRAQVDAIVVELSGVGEPGAARTVLDELQHTPPAYIARTVTVVDTQAFAEDYVAEVAADHVEERLSALLAEQIEDADLVVLNKIDLATPKELQQAEALVSALNGTADIHSIEHGRIEVETLLPLSMLVESPQRGLAYDLTHGQGHSHDHGGIGHSHDHGHGDCNHDHRSSAERRFGIRSFVYSAERPFNKFRFMTLLQGWQQSWLNLGRRLQLQAEFGDSTCFASTDVDSPSVELSSLAPILRSKGLLWLDNQVTEALCWSHAGRCVRISSWGMWGDEAATSAAAKGHSVEQMLAPKTELVFIGSGVNEVAVRAALDACIVSDEEFASICRNIHHRHMDH